MKRICLTFVILVVVLTVQAQNCIRPVSNGLFQERYRLMSKANSDQNRLDLGVAFSAVKCMSSNQVLLMAKLFNKESSRLEFCRLAYKNTVDKGNFYDVYNAFTTFGYAFRLHDILDGKVVDVLADEPDGPKHPIDPIKNELTFPDYKYPVYANYEGPIGCTTPISERDFVQLATSVFKLKGDDLRQARASIVIRQNCLSMAQAMKLTSLLKLEVKRLDLLKTSFQYVHDQNNYSSAKQNFSHIPYQNDWMQYCRSYLAEAEPTESDEPEVVCTVEEDKLKTMLSNIDKASFADDQMAVVKALNNHHCFSTKQVGRIMKEFSFPTNRLDVAKLLYGKCSDPENYYRVC